MSVDAKEEINDLRRQNEFLTKQLTHPNAKIYHLQKCDEEAQEIFYYCIQVMYQRLNDLR